MPSVSDRVAAPVRDQVSVKVEDLHVTYRTTYEKVSTLKKTLMRLGRSEKAVREVNAVRGVSF